MYGLPQAVEQSPRARPRRRARASETRFVTFEFKPRGARAQPCASEAVWLQRRRRCGREPEAAAPQPPPEPTRRRASQANEEVQSMY